MSRLLITGAAGFLGAATARLAVRAGHEVLALVRPGSPAPRLAGLDLTRIEADLRDAAAITQALSAHRPDAVLHLAWSGVANAQRFDRTQITENVEPACALVEAAAAAGAKSFIGLGSQGEYGPLDRIIDETALPRPTTLYGAAKLATLCLTRQLAAQHGLRHAWLRLFDAYGPDDNPGWLIPMLITEMLAGRRPRTTLGTQHWDWLHIDDAAAGVLAVATSETAEGVFNLGSGEPVPVRAVVEMIRDMAAPGMALVFGEIPFRPDQVMHMQADNARLRAATGWAPRIGLAAGMAATIAWYRQHRQHGQE